MSEEFDFDAIDGDGNIVLSRSGGNQLPMRETFPVDETGEFSDDEIFEFYRLSYDCYSPEEIAWSLNWTPRKLTHFTADDERLALSNMVREALNGGMERAVYWAGRRGNVTAARLWLFCQARHRGWADTRQVHVTAQSRQEVVVSIARGTQQAIQAGVIEHGELAVLALQQAYIDVDSEEADAD